MAVGWQVIADCCAAGMKDAGCIYCVDLPQPTVVGRQMLQRNRARVQIARDLTETRARELARSLTSRNGHALPMNEREIVND